MMDVTTGFALFGFPISILLLAWVAVLLHERNAKSVPASSRSADGMTDLMDLIWMNVEDRKSHQETKVD